MPVKRRHPIRRSFGNHAVNRKCVISQRRISKCTYTLIHADTYTHTHNFSVRSSRNSLNISYVPSVVLRIQRSLSHSFPSLEESDAVGRAEEHPQSGSAIPEPAATQAGRRWGSRPQSD